MLFGGGIGFDMKLNLAIALGLLNVSTKEKLTLLNTIRNKCSHNWLLKLPQRRGRRHNTEVCEQVQELYTKLALHPEGDFVGGKGAEMTTARQLNLVDLRSDCLVK